MSKHFLWPTLVPSPFIRGRPNAEDPFLILTLLVGVFGVWQYRARSAASAAELARVLQLDPRKVEPSTRALVLLETIPRLRSADREVAAQRLRSTLEAMPRQIITHRPSFPVETIRFSGNGRCLLWYGKTADGIGIEKCFERDRRIHTWSSEASHAAFVDEAGTDVFSAHARALENETTATARTKARLVMSRDGGYLSSLLQGDVLVIWRVREVATDPGPMRAAFALEVPNATTRLQCIQATEICGLDTPGRFVVIDARKGKTLRSIAVDRAATVHMSPNGHLIGVASSRAGMTIHAARHGRKIPVDTSSFALQDYAFSADEKSVVVLDREGVLHSFDVATGKPTNRSSVLRHESWDSISRIQTVGDGRFVVWGAEKVRLVSADLSTVVARFDEGGEVVTAETNASGDRLAIARRTGPLTLWDISVKPTLPVIEAELIDAACDRIGRPLTAEEWAAYFPGRRYFPNCR